MTIPKLILAGLLCSASAMAIGEIYKWVDEKGQTQYSGTPPSGRAHSRLQPAPPPSAEEQRRAQERLKQEMQRLQAMREARMKALNEADKELQERAKREMRCEEVKVQLKFLEETQGLRWVEPGKPDGEAVHWLSDEDKEDVVQAWRKEVQTVCESSGFVADQPPPSPGVVGPPFRKPKPPPAPKVNP